MQISVLSFTLGYDPKLGISQHLRTRYIFFAAAANIETTTSTVNDFNDKMVLTPNKSILHAFWTVCTFSNNVSIWRYLAFLEIFWMTLGSLQIMWTIWRLD